MSATNPISEQLRDAAQVIDLAGSKLPKYHKRRPSERQLAARRREQTAPSNTTGLLISNLTKTAATKHLREIDAIKSPAQLFREAIESKLLSLAWQIRCDVENRAKGKPYVAINPDERAKPAAINDNRLQIAIQQLIPSKSGANQGKKPRKIAAEPVLELPADTSTIVSQ